jgi:hypothetical protein
MYHPQAPPEFVSKVTLKAFLERGMEIGNVKLLRAPASPCPNGLLLPPPINNPKGSCKAIPGASPYAESPTPRCLEALLHVPCERSEVWGLV